MGNMAYIKYPISLFIINKFSIISIYRNIKDIYPRFFNLMQRYHISNKFMNG